MIGPYTLLKDALITKCRAAVAAGTSAQNTDVLDMLGFNSVCFIFHIGTSLDTAVITLTVKENSANSTSSPAPTAVTNAAPTFTDAAGNASDTLMVADCHDLTKRYVFAAITRTVANVVINSVVAIRYNAKNVPVTLDSTVIASALAIP